MEDFTTRVLFDRWEQIRTTYEAWWEGSLDRPIVNLFVTDPADVARERIGPPPDLHYTRFTGWYPESVPVRAIVDRYDWELASRRYVADGFPSTWPNFGAGSLAALTGCTLNARPDTIWFDSPGVGDPAQLTIPAQVRSPVAERIADFYHEAVRVFRGDVQLGMVDLGGTLDVLQSFFPSERLSLELYDNPGEIKRLTGEVHDAWWAHFAAFQAIIGESNPGYTAWTPLLSRASYYMLQCDFAYMIGPEMFDEFVLPELTASCSRLDRPFYHLDGSGQLIHLEKILAIPGLAGVQWIPGDGAPDATQWPDVYRRIRDAGKRIQLFVHQSDRGVGILDVLAEQLGDLRGVALVGDVPAGRAEDQARAVLARHGVPW